jgi:hypothetical protein
MKIRLTNVEKATTALEKANEKFKRVCSALERKTDDLKTAPKRLAIRQSGLGGLID